MSDRVKALTEPQLRGIQARVQAAINRSVDGAHVHIDYATARNVVRALRQHRHFELVLGCENYDGHLMEEDQT